MAKICLLQVKNAFNIKRMLLKRNKALLMKYSSNKTVELYIHTYIIDHYNPSVRITV